jgi:XTP/dITP diphosphohydrolase
VRLALATANPHKAVEIRAILGSLPGLELLPRPPIPAVEETGTTLVENARFKARAVAEAAGWPAVADDSGLEVLALGGAPGVHSAYYAGEGATYAENVAKLLRALEGVEDRRAVFRTVALVAWPGRSRLEVLAEGRVEGTIATEPRGGGGFGYDPVFVPAGGDGRTFAEMAAGEKDALSHRGRAFRALAERLGYFGEQEAANQPEAAGGAMQAKRPGGDPGVVQR